MSTESFFMKQILDQTLKWDKKTNHTALVTKYDDGTILYEPITSEEASLWQAEHKY